MSKITDTIKDLKELEAKHAEGMKLFADAQIAQQAATKALDEARTAEDEATLQRKQAEQSLQKQEAIITEARQEMLNRERTLASQQADMDRKQKEQSKKMAARASQLDAIEADVQRRETILNEEAERLRGIQVKYDAVAAAIAQI